MTHSGFWTVALSLLALSGCGSMPWSKGAAGAPVPVNALVVSAGEGATQQYPQYWKRNTLVVDLQAASGSGSITLRPGAEGWPKRLAFRVMPGSVGLLEVQADQRMLMPVSQEGTTAVDLELVPGVYTPQTQSITVRWEPVKAPPG